MSLATYGRTVTALHTTQFAFFPYTSKLEIDHRRPKEKDIKSKAYFPRVPFSGTISEDGAKNSNRNRPALIKSAVSFFLPSTTSVNGNLLSSTTLPQHVYTRGAGISELPQPPRVCIVDKTATTQSAILSTCLRRRINHQPRPTDCQPALGSLWFGFGFRQDYLKQHIPSATT